MDSLKRKIWYFILGGILILSSGSLALAKEEMISLSKEEKEILDLLSKKDKKLLALSENEQVNLAIKNSSEVYRLGNERSITLRRLWIPSISAEYGHEIIDRNRLGSIRRGQEEATYWIEYDFMDIFDNTKRARAYQVEKGTYKHKIRYDVRELRGKIRLSKQKIKKCRNDYAQLKKDYKELREQIIHPPDKQHLSIRYSQDSQRLYLTLKNAQQELLGYQYALLALIRGHTRIGYIR